jgi:hypothetical protein
MILVLYEISQILQIFEDHNWPKHHPATRNRHHSSDMRDMLERGHQRKMASFAQNFESLHGVELRFVSIPQQSRISVERCGKSIEKTFHFVAIASKPTDEFESLRSANPDVCTVA